MKYTDNDSTMATKMDRHAANIAAYVEAETIEELNIQLAAANQHAERLAEALKLAIAREYEGLCSCDDCTTIRLGLSALAEHEEKTK